MADYVVYLGIFAVILLAFVPVVIRTRRRARYAYFRVIDGKTKAPLAGFEVHEIKGKRKVWSQEDGVGVLLAPGIAAEKIGNLDADGTFKRTFSVHGSGVVTVKGPGITSGVISLVTVSELRAFPSAPFECALQMGTISPPTKRSRLSRGIEPGQIEESGLAIVNIYEEPKADEEWLGYRTLDEAKTANMNGSLARYWEVEGRFRPDPLGGTAITVTVERVVRRL